MSGSLHLCCPRHKLQFWLDSPRHKWTSPWVCPTARLWILFHSTILKKNHINKCQILFQHLFGWFAIRELNDSIFRVFCFSSYSPGHSAEGDLVDSPSGWRRLRLPNLSKQPCNSLRTLSSTCLSSLDKSANKNEYAWALGSQGHCTPVFHLNNSIIFHYWAFIEVKINGWKAEKHKEATHFLYNNVNLWFLCLRKHLFFFFFLLSKFNVKF